MRSTVALRRRGPERDADGQVAGQPGERGQHEQAERDAVSSSVCLVEHDEQADLDHGDGRGEAAVDAALRRATLRSAAIAEPAGGVRPGAAHALAPAKVGARRALPPARCRRVGRAPDADGPAAMAADRARRCRRGRPARSQQRPDVDVASSARFGRPPARDRSPRAAPTAAISDRRRHEGRQRRHRSARLPRRGGSAGRTAALRTAGSSVGRDAGPIRGRDQRGDLTVPRRRLRQVRHAGTRYRSHRRPCAIR